MVSDELACLRIFGESLANVFWGTDTLANLRRKVFGELTRSQIFGESLANGFLDTDTLANLWRLFGECFLAN